jgi:hypothetical protein
MSVQEVIKRSEMRAGIAFLASLILIAGILLSLAGISHELVFIGIVLIIMAVGLSILAFAD